MARHAGTDQDLRSTIRIAALVLIFMPLLRVQPASAPRPFPQSVADWQTLIPAIREVLKEVQGVEEHYSIGIRQIADLTGDGVPEALVYLGVGGASTDEMMLMRIVDGKPVLAIFRQRSGKVSSMTFLRGASVMHTDTVELLPKEHAVHSVHYSFGGLNPDGVQKVHECGGEAYQWNPHTQTFEYNRRLSNRLTQDYCRKVREHWR